ncbi:Neuronal acetylcholine receptor subunit alpha-9 [Folsomia candida]|uniref:Neuronal acetylcholine receptor subunit alpha-9 n=1 Tax=Folsomia candida TaxID=158441 RepID=A0A226EF45_FOLCA|nr:Neuronal acetylcholine receptor subunit alpha-9 [Folsomia candida]
MNKNIPSSIGSPVEIQAKFMSTKSGMIYTKQIVTIYDKQESLLVFFVPCDSGEKVTLGISALLSMTVFLMTIRESLPPTEKTPLIALYYGVSICIVTFASALAVFTLNIHHRGFRGVTVPRLLRFICLKILAKVLLIQGDPEESTATVEQKESQLDAFRELRLQLNGLHPAIRLDSRSASRKYDYTDVVQRSPRFEPKTTNVVGTGGGGSAGGTGTGQPASLEDIDHKFSRIASKICETIERCELRTAAQTKQDANQLEWKKIALVCDRFLFWAFTIVTAVSATLILFSSPYGPTFSMFYDI